MIAQHAARTSEENAEEVARALIQETGILSEFRQENTPESLMRWENVQELLNAVAEYAAECADARGRLALEFSSRGLAA